MDPIEARCKTELGASPAQLRILARLAAGQQAGRIGGMARAATDRRGWTNKHGLTTHGRHILMKARQLGW